MRGSIWDIFIAIKKKEDAIEVSPNRL